jgi:hypothetical protein
MDDRLKQALDFANLRNTFELQKKTLREKLNARLTYGYSGGIFIVDQTLICFIEFLISQGRFNDVILLDSNNNPVLISDLTQFKNEIIDRYFSGSLEYYNEIQKLKRNRSIEKMVDYE